MKKIKGLFKNCERVGFILQDDYSNNYVIDCENISFNTLEEAEDYAISYHYYIADFYTISKKDFKNICNDYKCKDLNGKWTTFESSFTHQPSTTLLTEGQHFEIV